MSTETLTRAQEQEEHAGLTCFFNKISEIPDIFISP